MSSHGSKTPSTVKRESSQSGPKYVSSTRDLPLTQSLRLANQDSLELSSVADLNAVERIFDRTVPPMEFPPRIEGITCLLKERRGGFGVVYKGLLDGSSCVAVKVILGSRNAPPRLLELISNEIAVLSQIEHRQVAQLLGWKLTEQGEVALIMRWVDGVDLLDHRICCSGTLADRIAVFRLLLDPLSYLHERSVIHRDLKPSNIRVSAEGVPTILDLGIATIAQGAGTPTRWFEHGICGTPAYMSPEQKVGVNQPTNDMYSLGIVLFEMIARQFPYATCQVAKEHVILLRDVLPQCPQELERIVAKAMSWDRGDRYQTIAELAQDIDAFAGSYRPVPGETHARCE